MAVSYLISVGYNYAKQISDELIDNAKGSELITEEYHKHLLKLTREIANASTPGELIQLCQAEDLYEIRFSANKLGRDRLEELLNKAILYLLNDRGLAIEDIASELGADSEEMFMIGGYDLKDN